MRDVVELPHKTLEGVEYFSLVNVSFYNCLQEDQLDNRRGRGEGRKR